MERTNWIILAGMALLFVILVYGERGAYQSGWDGGYEQAVEDMRVLIRKRLMTNWKG